MTFEWCRQLRIYHRPVLLADGHDTTQTAYACGVMSCSDQYLDCAVAAVDPDPVAGVQEHGGVAASDE